MRKDTERRSRRSDFGRRKNSRRKRRRQVVRSYLLLFLVSVLVVAGLWNGIGALRDRISREKLLQAENQSFIGAPPFEVDLLDNNEYSRPGTALNKINGIVVHYTANPGSTAKNNRDYFNGLKDSHETKASSHFVVGIEGEIVQCIPSTEVAYASNSRNDDTLSIECCHTDETGKFTEETYTSLVRLTGWLCQRFGLDSESVIRHYDVTGKICPKYFVDYPEQWEQFKADVKAQIKEVEKEVREAEEK